MDFHATKNNCRDTCCLEAFESNLANRRMGIMFHVNDTQQQRHERIQNFNTQKDILLGLILSAIDFEWTVRRAIIILGYRPNKIILSESLLKCHGAENYKKAWKAEVYPYRKKGICDVISNWSDLRGKAFELRNRVVHGIKGVPAYKQAQEARDLFLHASKEIEKYVHETVKRSVYGKLPVRIKERPLK